MRYNFKDIDRVQETEFCCPICLTEEIITALKTTEGDGCIDLIANSDVITDVMRVLLNSEVDGEMFTLGMVNIDGGYDYDMEHTLTINNDHTIWVEPTWRNFDGEMKLYDTEAYITYVHDDCNSKILQKLNINKNRVMIFDFEEEFDDDEDIGLYDLVEGIVEDILDKRYGRFQR